MIGEIFSKTPVSIYQPSKQVANATMFAKRDYQVGFDILHRPWNELNDYSVIDRQNKDQRTFNSFVDESVDDPAQAWKWRGTRGMARNKTIVAHAHLTSGYIVPGASAVDEEQQDHRDMGNLMGDILNWMTMNSNYRPSFILATMGMLVNPVTYLSADYAQVMQTIINRDENDVYSKEQIIDEVFSGFQANCMSADQILIMNAHEQNIQKQRSITKRRWREYNDLKAQYGKHPNWEFVRPGIRMVYNDEDGLFYEVKDTEYSYRNLCEETIFQCRGEDTEIPYINGIYFGNIDNVEWNPIRHRDNRNAPKYNIVPFGYQRVNEHFFYFKSLINIIGWDDKLMDAIYEMTMNRAILDTEQPIAVTGSDKVDTSVMFPSAVATFEDKDTKIIPLLQPSRGEANNAMVNIEKSMSEASVSPLEAGEIGTGGGSQRAFMIALANQNAKIVMDSMRRTINDSVREFGQLMVDIALTHLTTPQVDALGGVTYRAFLLKDQMIGGKKVSKRIRFDDFLMGRSMTKQEKHQYTMGLLEEVGYPYNKEHLYVANPYLFSKYKYMAFVDADSMQGQTSEDRRAMITKLYQLLRQDPLVEPEALIRRLVHSYFRNDYEELIAKNPQAVMGGEMITRPGGGGALPQGDGMPIKPAQPGQNIQNQTKQPAVAQSIGAGRAM